MKNIFLSLCILLISREAIARGDVPYHYAAYDPADGVINISIGVDPPVVYVGHAGRGAEICQKDEAYYCVESVVFQFSVPKEQLKIGLNWQRNGHEYKITDCEEMVVFGRTMNVFVIEESFSDKPNAIFLYSQKNGLVGFLLASNNSFSPLYLLKEDSGFPVQH